MIQVIITPKKRGLTINLIIGNSTIQTTSSISENLCEATGITSPNVNLINIDSKKIDTLMLLIFSL